MKSLKISTEPHINSHNTEDKLKLAKIIAKSLGLSPATISKNTSPEKLINLALTYSKDYKKTPKEKQIITNMINIIKSAGIHINEDKSIVDFDLTDKEIDDLISGVDSLDDIIDTYRDDELHLIDSKGKHISELSDLKGIHESEDVLNEVLSRIERIRASIRFKQTEGSRERKLKLALKMKSSPIRINHRARVTAIKLLKLKFIKQPLNTLSIAQKERVERFIETKKTLINRIALKLVPKLREIENTRLHPKPS